MSSKKKNHASAPNLSLKLSSEMTHKAIPIGKQIGGLLAEEVAGGLAGMIVGQFMNLIFPPDDSDFFDKVYHNVARVVRRELNRHDRENIALSLQNIMRFLRNDYASSRRTFTKDDPGLSDIKKREELTRMLQKRQDQYVSGSSGMMSRLMHTEDSEAAQAAFSLFLLGGSIQLAILQELANVDALNVDSNNKPKKPLESRYGQPENGIMAKYAHEYATYAKPVWQKIVEKRDLQIYDYPVTYHDIRGTHYWGVVMIDEYHHPGINEENRDSIANDLLDDPKYKWKIRAKDDAWSYPKYLDHLPAFKKKIDKEYRPKALADFSKELSYPSKTIELWHKMVKDPINVKQAKLLKTLRSATLYKTTPPDAKHVFHKHVDKGQDVIDYIETTKALKDPKNGGQWFFDEVRIVGGPLHGQLGYLARCKQDGSSPNLG